MNTAAIETVRDELIKKDENFKNMVQKHEKYEQRLSQLAKLNYPNDDEILEETKLKKKKLLLKDEIYSILSNHSQTATSKSK